MEKVKIFFKLEKRQPKHFQNNLENGSPYMDSICMSFWWHRCIFLGI